MKHTQMKYRRARAEGGTYFFTVVTYRRKRFLCEPDNVSHLREAFRYVMARPTFLAATTKDMHQLGRSVKSG